MSKLPALEQQVHGRQRDLSSPEELRFGVHEEMLYARNRPGIEGAQWTGIVTQAGFAPWASVAGRLLPRRDASFCGPGSC